MSDTKKGKNGMAGLIDEEDSATANDEDVLSQLKLFNEINKERSTFRHRCGRLWNGLWKSLKLRSAFGHVGLMVSLSIYCVVGGVVSRSHFIHTCMHIHFYNIDSISICPKMMPWVRHTSTHIHVFSDSPEKNISIHFVSPPTTSNAISLSHSRFAFSAFYLYLYKVCQTGSLALYILFLY